MEQLTSQTNVVFLTTTPKTKQIDIINNIATKVLGLSKFEIVSDVKNIDFNIDRLFTIIAFGSNYYIPNKTNIIKTYNLPLLSALDKDNKNKETRQQTLEQLKTIKQEISNININISAPIVPIDNITFTYQNKIYEITDDKQLLPNSMVINTESLEFIKLIKEVFPDITDIRIVSNGLQSTHR